MGRLLIIQVGKFVSLKNMLYNILYLKTNHNLVISCIIIIIMANSVLASLKHSHAVQINANTCQRKYSLHVLWLSRGSLPVSPWI